MDNFYEEGVFAMPARKELNMNTFEGKFAARMLELRLAAGLSQEEAAEKIGVKVGTVYEWECARKQPAVMKFPLIASVYGIPLQNILENL